MDTTYNKTDTITAVNNRGSYLNDKYSVMINILNTDNIHNREIKRIVGIWV